MSKQVTVSREDLEVALESMRREMGALRWGAETSSCDQPTIRKRGNEVNDAIQALTTALDDGGERPEGVPEFVYCNVDCDEPRLVEDVIGGPPYIICLTEPNSDRLKFARYRFDGIVTPEKGGE